MRDRAWARAGAALGTLVLLGGLMAPAQNAARELTVDTSALPVLVAGERVSMRLSARGGAPPLRWFAYGTMPEGLRLDESGLLSGAPLDEGSFEIEAQVEDSAGGVATRALRIDVVAAHEEAASSSSFAELESNLNVNGSGLSTLIQIVDGLEEGDWTRVNENLFSDVWTPEDRRTLVGSSIPTPASIVLPWSSFAWDTRRWDLVIYGGGHANYSGNDVYRWRGSTRRWERASLPSEIVQYSPGIYFAIDGVDAAPASAHTYDNAIYLEIADRFLTYGGAAYNSGRAFVRPVTPTTNRPTGPYLFDLSKSDGSKVGGTTGSHVKRVAPYPETLGGEMWENRDIYASIPGSPPLPQSFINGATGYQRVGGSDVIYVSGAAGGTALSLYRHTIPDRSDPSKDTWEQVGRFWEAFSGAGSGAYDPFHNVFVRTGGNRFTYWDLSTASPLNDNVLFTPEVLSGNFVLDQYFGMDFDPVRRVFVLWRGDGRLWKLVPPTPVAREGWTIEELPPPTSPTPNGNIGTGILGKWKYVPNMDVFIGLQDAVAGNIWLYKPHGWQRPTPVPIVFLTQPAEGASFLKGDDILLEAEASDPDGSIARVEFYRGAVKLGEDHAEPYSFLWGNVPTGNFSLTATAFDSAGANAVSPAVRIAISSGNQLPQVTVTAPAPGQIFVTGTSINLAAQATDADGTVTAVEFYQGAVKLGEDLTSPYSFLWPNVPAGSYSITAVATDDDLEAATTPAVPVYVSDDSRATVELREGLGGYSGTRDTYLDSWLPTTNYGNKPTFLDNTATLHPLVRFAVYQSAGGPIPDGSTIHSATLALYKSSVYPQTYRLHRTLRDWVENQATWNLSSQGQPWSVPGAMDFGNDLAIGHDAEAAVGWDPQWVQFNVTNAVRDFGSGQTNYGWRLVPVFSDSNIRTFPSREASDASLRPKLTINYSTGNLHPSVSLTAPTPGSVFPPGSNISLQATASDADGTVVRVEFFQGAVKLGEDSTSPYSLTWTNVAAGSYSLTAVAIDDGGASRTSTPVPISVAPTNSLPQVSLTAPLPGQSFAAGSDITIAAQASDSDGTVVRVEFYQGAVELGEDFTAPHSFLWVGVPAGNYSLTAVAFDDDGASASSAPVAISVNASSSGTVELQDGLAGYAGTRDTRLDGWLPTVSFGNASTLLDQTTKLNSLVRFAIFQSAGGPIPEGAVIQSATLHFYKSSAYDHVYRVHRVLRDWQENQATWNLARQGESWSVPGAAGLGSDIASTHEAEATAGWNPQWIQFDVTNAVISFGSGQPNYGFRLVPVLGNPNMKTFVSREATDVSHRPKLVVVTSGGNLPPTASLTSPAPGAVFAPGSNITLQANASDADGTVERVEFYQGAVKLGEDSTSPYSFAWTNVASGSYSLTAVAIDNAGATGSSAPVLISVAAVNSPPQVALTQPTQGQTFTSGSNITMAAQASDSDGTVARVEFFQGAVKLGEDSTAPYSFVWAGVPAGSYALTARAVDDDGASATSLPIDITVTSGSSGTVVLQNGAGGYTGTRDAYLDAWLTSTNFGSSASLLDMTTKLNPLVRFAIFQSAGGPVPDGSVIESATLHLYKSSYYDHLYRVHRVLRDWVENEASWTMSRAGQPWAGPGATGIGSDILAAPDAETTAGWNPQWLQFDVTNAVRAFASGQTNCGWRIVPVQGNNNLKSFSSREASDPSLRPKLVITYSVSAQ